MTHFLLFIYQSKLQLASLEPRVSEWLDTWRKQKSKESGTDFTLEAALTAN